MKEKKAFIICLPSTTKPRLVEFCTEYSGTGRIAKLIAKEKQGTLRPSSGTLAGDK